MVCYKRCTQKASLLCECAHGQAVWTGKGRTFHKLDMCIYQRVGEFAFSFLWSGLSRHNRSVREEVEEELVVKVNWWQFVIPTDAM